LNLALVISTSMRKLEGKSLS